MSESKMVRAFGVLGALVAASVLAVGCSSAAPGEGGSAPEVKDPGLSPEMNLGSQIIQVWPTSPLPQYCLVAGTYLPAHFVEKVPNDWGKRPGGVDYTVVPNRWNGHGADSRFADGYSIPFPTAWVDPGSTLPDPHTYEQSLWWVPSTLWWQYLVHDMERNADARTYSEDVGHAFFMVGVPSLADFDKANNLALANATAPVDARVNKCVRIVTRSGQLLHDTGEFFLVYDEHDPRNPPN